MTDAQKKVKRKSISKKLRFEVFKRDMFTCQYCGRKAPDVVLHIDHIKPVSKGGRNEIMNLVTSCIDCNLGKGAKTLSDQSVVERQRKQAEYLAQRREQIEMLRDWQLEMLEQENLEVEAVDNLVSKLTNGEYRIAENYKTQKLRKIIRQFGVQIVMDGLQEGFVSYGGNLEKTLDKLPGICACKADPVTGTRVYLLNIMNKKFFNFRRNDASLLLRRGYEIGGQDFYDAVYSLINKMSGTWYQVHPAFESLVKNWGANR